VASSRTLLSNYVYLQQSRNGDGDNKCDVCIDYDDYGGSNYDDNDDDEDAT